jgi:hypothetical protein
MTEGVNYISPYVDGIEGKRRFVSEEPPTPSAEIAGVVEKLEQARHQCSEWMVNEDSGMSGAIEAIHDAEAALGDALTLLQRLDGSAAWQPMETAPKDGTSILVLTKADEIEDGKGGVHERKARPFIARWDPEGDSWVDENGELGGDAHHLAVTGVWSPPSRGWLQPNEVTHWMPLPAPPTEGR